jgi:hypothetical protein
MRPRWIAAIAPFRRYLPDLPDVIGIAGAAAMCHGIARVYAPAAWIAGGLLALIGAVLLARKGGA